MEITFFRVWVGGGLLRMISALKKPRDGDKSRLGELPSTEEVRELQEGQELFRSNLFRLQLKELLGEVKVPQSKTAVTQDELRGLKEAIETAEERELGTEDLLSMAVPLHGSAADPKLHFHFRAPRNLQVIGSFLLNTVCRPDTNVDLAVEIPKVRQSFTPDISSLTSLGVCRDVLLLRMLQMGDTRIRERSTSSLWHNISKVWKLIEGGSSLKRSGETATNQYFVSNSQVVSFYSSPLLIRAN